MKTLRATMKIVGLGSLLTLAFGFTTSLALADSNPQSSPPPTTTKQIDTAKPSDPAAMVCPVCKTTVLLGSADVSPPNSRAFPRWPKNGFKHTCGHCGGELTAMNGKMINAMQGNCAMCGKDAGRCVAAQNPAKTA